jgi:hypothetical protein
LGAAAGVHQQLGRDPHLAAGQGVQVGAQLGHDLGGQVPAGLTGTGPLGHVPGLQREILAKPGRGTAGTGDSQRPHPLQDQLEALDLADAGDPGACPVLSAIARRRRNASMSGRPTAVRSSPWSGRVRRLADSRAISAIRSRSRPPVSRPRRRDRSSTA